MLALLNERVYLDRKNIDHETPNKKSINKIISAFNAPIRSSTFPVSPSELSLKTR